ncbi:unnamed protein product [Pleuronectes platessa]|uniref:G-protein coupled receptors family 1 profile domain-containing protein n=1 Tax=Pleuronectes platessa TaxID=8262 RepID=A0A9N7YYT6_PLEPL|nr:unnamed protein product [Pleuronectes platessa]
MISVCGLQNLVPSVLIWIMTFKSCLGQFEENSTAMNYSEYNDSRWDYDDYPILCDKASNRQFRLWFMSTFYSLICFLGLVGNLLVILTFFYFKRLKTMTDVYLLNLSFADLLFSLTLPFWAANSMAHVDRYFAISRAVSAHHHRTQAVFFSKVSSAVIWIMAMLFSVPDMMYTTINNKTCTPYSSSSDQLRIGIQTGQIVLAFVLPLLVMSFCYSSIIQTLCQARNFERNKAIKVILAVVLAFLRCCLNPFVYAFIGVKFRRDLLKLLKDFGCMSQERFFRYNFGRRRSSLATDTETTTTFSP